MLEIGRRVGELIDMPKIGFRAISSGIKLEGSGIMPKGRCRGKVDIPIDRAMCRRKGQCVGSLQEVLEDRTTC